MIKYNHLLKKTLQIFKIMTIVSDYYRGPDRSRALRPDSLLRTVQETFTAHSSSISKGEPYGSTRQ